MSENREQKLGGTLIKNPRESKEGNENIEIGTILIQRDSGAEFLVERINETNKVLLRSKTDNSTVLKAKEDLVSQLNTPGSAWRRKE